MLTDNQKGTEVLVKEDGTYEWVNNDKSHAMDLDQSSEQLIHRVPEVKKVMPQKMDVEESARVPEKRSKPV